MCRRGVGQGKGLGDDRGDLALLVQLEQRLHAVAQQRRVIPEMPQIDPRDSGVVIQQPHRMKPGHAEEMPEHSEKIALWSPAHLRHTKQNEPAQRG